MKENPTMIPVVAVALVAPDGRVLMQQRRIGGAHGGLWEYPGGKIEPGESPESAILREIREELGIDLHPGSLEPLSFASDPRLPPQPREPHVILLYMCREWTGEPRCLEGEAIGWFAPHDLDGLEMPPLDRPLTKVLLNVI